MLPSLGPDALKAFGPLFRIAALLAAPASFPIARIIVQRMDLDELKRRDYLLRVTNVDVPYEIYVAAVVFYGIVAAVLGLVLFKLLHHPLALAPIALPASMILYPQVVQRARIKEIEENLPDALRQMVEELRAGSSVFEVVKSVAEGNYGALSEEFSIVVREMDMGKTFEEAMLDMAERVDSEILRRAIRLTVRISISGGTLADVLEAVENDIREVRRIELERQAVTTMPCLTMGMGGVICAIPVGVALGAVMGLGAKAGGATTMGALLPMYQLLSRYMVIYPATVGFLSGIAIGIIRYGDPREGLKFAFGISTASAMAYLGLVTVFPSLLAQVGGGP